MEIEKAENKLPRYLLFAVLFLLILPPLEAEDSSELLPIRLLWNQDEYAFYYEVKIETTEDAEQPKEMQVITSQSMVEVLLKPGKYRCQVIPYDFLEKPGTGSRWIDFEVRRAVIEAPPALSAIPEEAHPAGAGEEEISVEYVKEDIEEDTDAGTIIKETPPAKTRRSISPYLSAAWAPLLPVYGEPKPFYEGGPSLLGAGASFGILITKWSLLKPGLELTGSWYLYEQHSFTAGLNLVAQKDINRYLAFRFHLGAGMTFFDGGLNWHSLLGLSFLIYPHPRFYFKTGFDYTHLFTEASPGHHPGCIRPALGIGFQF